MPNSLDTTARLLGTTSKPENETFMTYSLNGNSLLFAIDRTEIIDISAGDTISVDGFPGVKHVWTEQDGDFVENNPDDEIFLQVQRLGEKDFKAGGILLKIRA
jgi:hypothetical protein